MAYDDSRDPDMDDFLFDMDDDPFGDDDLGGTGSWDAEGGLGDDVDDDIDDDIDDFGDDDPFDDDPFDDDDVFGDNPFSDEDEFKDEPAPHADSPMAYDDEPAPAPEPTPEPEPAPVAAMPDSASAVVPAVGANPEPAQPRRTSLLGGTVALALDKLAERQREIDEARSGRKAAPAPVPEPEAEPAPEPVAEEPRHADEHAGIDLLDQMVGRTVAHADAPADENPGMVADEPATVPEMTEVAAAAEETEIPSDPFAFGTDAPDVPAADIPMEPADDMMGGLRYLDEDEDEFDLGNELPSDPFAFGTSAPDAPTADIPAEPIDDIMGDMRYSGEDEDDLGNELPSDPFEREDTGVDPDLDGFFEGPTEPDIPAETEVAEEETTDDATEVDDATEADDPWEVFDASDVPSVPTDEDGWPLEGIGTKVPKPSFGDGRVEASMTGTVLLATLAEASFDEVRSYVEQLASAGFAYGRTETRGANGGYVFAATDADGAGGATVMVSRHFDGFVRIFANEGWAQVAGE